MCAQIPCRDPQHLPVAMSAGFQVLANLLDTAHRSLDFYTGQMRSLSDIESLRNEQCSVCSFGDAVVLTHLPPGLRSLSAGNKPDVPILPRSCAQEIHVIGFA